MVKHIFPNAMVDVVLYIGMVYMKEGIANLILPKIITNGVFEHVQTNIIMLNQRKNRVWTIMMLYCFVCKKGYSINTTDVNHWILLKTFKTINIELYMCPVCNTVRGCPIWVKKPLCCAVQIVDHLWLDNVFNKSLEINGGVKIVGIKDYMPTHIYTGHLNVNIGRMEFVYP